MRSKYETSVLPYIEKIEKWIEQGADIKEVAENLHVAYSAFRRYLDRAKNGDKRYEALRAAFARAAPVPNEVVKASLFRLCNGYNATVMRNYKIKRTKYDPVSGKKVEESEEIVQRPEEVHVQANVTAQMFWLTNRDRENWKYDPDKIGAVDPEGTGVVEIPSVDVPSVEIPSADVPGGDSG